jgi:galactokinase
VNYNQQDVANKFRALFNTSPLIVRSPGRINLIGEHTDYNNGFVMPAAIDYGTFFAIAEAHDGVSEIYSLMYDETISVDLQQVKPSETVNWVNYLLGIVFQLVRDGHTLKPFKCALGGNIPIGSGLSSSASVECGFAYALNELNALKLDKQEMVFMAQWSEHNFVGVKCGIMDQFASMMGKNGNVILLDCQSLDYSYSPLTLGEYAIVLCDTKVKHALVDSDYNRRRNECERGVALLQQYYPTIKSLRDVTEAMLEKHKTEFSGKEYNRCLYVVQEINRVIEANNHLQANDLISFGKKMYETHEGLSKLYEVSCPELDFFVDIAKNTPAVLGARMMGGGFGGCTINIVKSTAVTAFVDQIKASYKKQFNIDAMVYPVKISDGVSIVRETVYHP